MNRIERLLWEEANLREIQRAPRRSRIGALGKAVSIACALGIVLMLAARHAPSTPDAGLHPAMGADAAPVRSAAPPMAPDAVGSLPARSTPEASRFET